jgi:hypothetical protein
LSGLIGAVLGLHAWLLNQALTHSPAAPRLATAAEPLAVLASLRETAPPMAPVDGRAEVAAPPRPNDSSPVRLRERRTVGVTVAAPPAAGPPAAESEPVGPSTPAPTAEALNALLATVPSAAGTGAETASHGARLIAVALPGPTRAAAPDEPPPRPPPPALLSYDLSRGLLGGSGRLEWRVEGGCYRLRLESRLPVIGNLLTQTSEGCFDAHGLAPLRHTDRRLRRSERAVNFVRPGDGGAPVITFSASTARLPLRPGAQDRLSWMAQLATRLAGRGTLPVGSRLEMDVAGAGGELQPWVFVLQGVEADGSWHWRRRFDGAADSGDAAHDTQAEVWTDPARHHWPRRVRLTEGSGDPLELTLQSVQPLPN